MKHRDREKVKHCAGCTEDFYNDKNPYGVKKCWHLEGAVMQKRFRIHVDAPMDRRSNFEAVEVYGCRREKGFVLMNTLPSHIDPRVKVWIDDEKPAPPDAEGVKTYAEGLRRLKKGGVDILYLDYELGSPGCRGDALLHELVASGGTIPEEVHGISASYSGRVLIEQLAKSLRDTFKRADLPPDVAADFSRQRA